MKILAVGNSFAVDTMYQLPYILDSLGISCTLGCLYIAGCSVQQHYENFTEENSDYVYHLSHGGDWEKTPAYSIQRALGETDWDVISIQHGSNNGSRYTEPRCYDNLKALVDGIRKLAPKAKIVFNMAWVPEGSCTRKEMDSFGGDQLAMYHALTEVTQKQVSPAVDGVVPTGTAIQNARTACDQKLTRDDFHLSLDLGRYIAALTFGASLCGVDPHQVRWQPETDKAVLAKRAAEAAILCPFDITPLG